MFKNLKIVSENFNAESDLVSAHRDKRFASGQLSLLPAVA